MTSRQKEDDALEEKLRPANSNNALSTSWKLVQTTLSFYTKKHSLLDYVLSKTQRGKA